MDYKAALETEMARLESALESGITIKNIDGKSYKYRQIRENGKVRSEYLGVAEPSEIGIKKRKRSVAWLIKNQSKFLEGLRILQELKDK